jgi:hypothetical protein
MALNPARSPRSTDDVMSRTFGCAAFLARARSLCLPLLVLALAPTLATRPPLAPADVLADSPRRQGALGMPDPHSGSLLVTYYEAFLRDQNISAFRRQVLARYMEGTLTRLADTGNTQTRRASVFALGLIGSFQANPAVARALRDSDPTVRSLAELPQGRRVGHPPDRPRPEIRRGVQSTGDRPLPPRPVPGER